MTLQINHLEDGQLVHLDLKELELGQGLVGHLRCSADVLSKAASRRLKSSFEVNAFLFVMLLQIVYCISPLPKQVAW